MNPAWKDEIEARLASGESLRSIARGYGVCYQTIQYWREKWDMPKLKPAQLIGANHPNWRGGSSIDRWGYRLLYAPGRKKAHPYTYEHVLVAEKMIGRRLHKNEQVHHLNGDKLDNRPANLWVCTSTEHKLLHHQLQRMALELVRVGQIVWRDGSYQFA